MSVTKFGIVYDTTTLSLIRIVVPDTDSELTDGTHPLAAGEAQLLQPIETLPDPLTPDAVAALTAIVAEAVAGT